MRVKLKKCRKRTDDFEERDKNWQNQREEKVKNVVCHQISIMTFKDNNTTQHSVCIGETVNKSTTKQREGNAIQEWKDFKNLPQS
jgi:hypothetical protein